ncbi:MAG: hypothetical protein ACREUG_04105, partial [Steroidobacteraceae bacterium]
MGHPTRARRALRLARFARVGALILAAATADAGAGTTAGHAVLSVARSAAGAQSAGDRPVAAVLHLSGVVGPATSRYLERALVAAQADGDRLVILEMDTPGGLD